MNNDKPTLKFMLQAGGQYEGGFKLNVTATGEKEIAMAKELTDKLIEKIEKISVEIGKDYE